LNKKNILKAIPILTLQLKVQN